jgi:hypothetical protein
MEEYDSQKQHDPDTFGRWLDLDFEEDFGKGRE